MSFSNDYPLAVTSNISYWFFPLRNLILPVSVELPALLLVVLLNSIYLALAISEFRKKKKAKQMFSKHLQ